MNIKNNSLGRIGRLLYHARHNQNISLFEASQSTGISVAKLISIEEANIKYYQAYAKEAIELILRYGQFLQVDAHDLIREISQASNICQTPYPISTTSINK